MNTQIEITRGRNQYDIVCDSAHISENRLWIRFGKDIIFTTQTGWKITRVFSVTTSIDDPKMVAKLIKAI